jgi:hypothetical protein
MAEWQYQIHRVELESGSDFDQQLEKALEPVRSEGMGTG